MSCSCRGKQLQLIRTHLLTLISCSIRYWSRTSWQSRLTILVAFYSAASKAFSTLKCILRLCNLNSFLPHFQTIRAMPFIGQLPQRSQHKMEVPRRENRVYHAEVLEPFIGANLQSSWFLPIAKGETHISYRWLSEEKGASNMLSTCLLVIIIFYIFMKCETAPRAQQ